MVTIEQLVQERQEFQTLSIEQMNEIAALKADNKKLEEDYLKLQERLEEANKYKDRFYSLNSWLVTEVKLQDILEVQKREAEKALKLTKFSPYGHNWHNEIMKDAKKAARSITEAISEAHKKAEKGVGPGESVGVSTKELGDALRGVARDAHNFQVDTNLMRSLGKKIKENMNDDHLDAARYIHDDVPTGGLTEKD